jgi:signal transduction histidine kinase
MSSKNTPDVPDPVSPPPRAARAWSLAARLTAWYAISAFVLVFAGTGFFYWASVRHLDRAADQLLGDRVRVLQSVILNKPGNTDALRREVEEEWEAHQRSSYVIQVAMDRKLEGELRADYRKNLCIILGVALVVCSVAGYVIAHRGVRPIHAIVETAGRIRPTNLSERIDQHGLPAELHVLAATFNQMLDRLEQSFARLSRFSADIAHELRTRFIACGVKWTWR